MGIGTSWPVIGVVALLCCAIGTTACSNDTTSKGAASESGPGIVNQAEFDKFADAAELTDAQTVAVRERLRRFEGQYPGVVSSGDSHLVDGLVRHTRALVFAELTPEQIALYDQAILPGSSAHPLSQPQPTDSEDGG